tara:strand:- start:19851 stop:20303 length:453 start_codon:yes stop_codon:yes gene_type:complete
MKKLKYIDILFLIILILVIINHKFNIKIINNNDKPAILNLNQSIVFEIFELIILISLIIYCIIYSEYINGFIFIIAYIQHILQLVKCYRYENQKKKLSTILIYSILLLYNILVNKKKFIFIWLFAIIIHIISYYNKTKFMEIICLADYIN